LFSAGLTPQLISSEELAEADLEVRNTWDAEIDRQLYVAEKRPPADSETERERDDAHTSSEEVLVRVKAKAKHNEKDKRKNKTRNKGKNVIRS